MSTNKLTKDKILAQLNKGDMFAIEIKQALKISNIELWDSIKELRVSINSTSYKRSDTRHSKPIQCLMSRCHLRRGINWRLLSENNQAIKNPETLIQRDIGRVNGNISISAIDLTPPLTNHRK